MFFMRVVDQRPSRCEDGGKHEEEKNRMSMRLVCRQVELIPHTPTHITYLCLYAKMGRHRRKTSSWKTVMKKYLLWLSAEHPESYPEMERMMNSAIEAYGKLSFDLV